MLKIIGENIKQLRKQAGYNQSNLAQYLQVDQSLISKMENGERAITVDMMEKLSCLFGVPMKEIENEHMSVSPLTIAFRKTDISAEDMKTISVVNRLALNSEFMAELMKGIVND